MPYCLWFYMFYVEDAFVAFSIRIVWVMLLLGSARRPDQVRRAYRGQCLNMTWRTQV